MLMIICSLVADKSKLTAKNANYFHEWAVDFKEKGEYGLAITCFATADEICEILLSKHNSESIEFYLSAIQENCERNLDTLI